MKKTLVALAVTAFAASAYAVPVFENDTTKVDFWGSVRVGFDNVSKDTKVSEYADAETKAKAGKKSGNTKLRNQGSRLGVNVNHQLGDGFYALGGLQVRFDDVETRKKDDSRFGELHTRRAFVGLGKKEYGEITFGEQLTLADNYGLATDMNLGFTPSYITTEATSVAQYTYKGIDGLTLGANYNFRQTHDARGAALSNVVKNEYGVGALYQKDVADDQTLTLEGGYGRTNYETDAAYKHYRDGYEAAVGYRVGAVTLFSDFGYKYEKNDRAKTKSFYVAPGAQYQFNDKTRLYANYLYENVDVVKGKETKTHGVLAFVEHKLHKNVSVYLEGIVKKSKDYNVDGKFVSKSTDKGIATGLFVNW
ncbi:TPA: porin [Mannheimia haemolytica]